MHGGLPCPQAGAERPVNRVFGLTRCDDRFNVVLASSLAVGQDGPTCVGRCVACAREVGEEEEAKQTGAGGLDVGNGD